MSKRLTVIALAASFAATSLLPASFLPSARAANGNQFSNAAAQGESSQTQIRGETQQAVNELASMIDELDRNGIGGDELTTLKSIRDVMGKLSDKDMDKVIQLLQAARSAADPNSARQDMAQAAVAQKTIISQMNALLIKYRQQQELYDISMQFAQLADRQNANLKSVVGLVKASARRNNGRATENLDEAQKDSLLVQAGEEKALRDATGLLLQKLQTIADSADSESADKLHKSIKNAEDGKLSDSLKDATDQLGGGHIFSASSDERVARDRLYDLAQMVAPDQNSAEKLRHAIETLDAAIAEQKEIITETGAINIRVLRDAADTFAGLEDREGDLVDSVDRCGKGIVNVAPDAATALKSAQDRMQESRAELTGLRREPASDKEKAALAKLEETKKLLETQLAKADEKPAGDMEAQAKELKEKLATLRADQEKLNVATASAVPRMGPDLSKTEQRLTQTARDLQSEASSQSADVSHEIGLAGNDMSTASADLDRTLVPDAVAPENSAVAHLIKAEALLDAVIKKDEDIKKDMAKAEEAREKVAKLMEDQQKVDQKTDNAAAKQQASTPATTQPASNQPTTDQSAAAKAADAAKNQTADAAKAADDAKNQTADAAKAADEAKKQTADAAKDQANVAKATDEAKSKVAEASKDAAAPLDAAKKDMDAAKGALDKPDANAAKDPQKDAMNELAKAKEALDQQIKKDQDALGQKPDPQQALADAAKALQQAQDNVQKAQDQISTTQPASAMQQLAQQQQQLAAAVQQAAQADPQNQNLQQAQQQAQQAAQDLNQNQLNQAQQNMQQAQQNLQQAANPQPPQQGQPQQGQPQQGQPQQGQPQQGQPQQGQPQQGQPQQGQPQQGQPQQGQPQQGQPQQGQPQQGQPQQGQPQQGQPQQGQPQQGQPQQGQPQQGQPQAGQPQAGQPQAGQPQAGQPQAGQPQAGQPQAGQPQAGQPQAGQPQAGQPQAGQPQAGQPQAGQPQAGQPQPGQPGQPGQPQQGGQSANAMPGGQDPASLARKEADLEKAVAAMAAEAANAQALQQAAAALAAAASDVNKASANDQGALPSNAQQAMQQASQAASEAAAQAQAGNTPSANNNAQAAQSALAQAQAAVAMAQSGMQSDDQAGHPGEPGSKPENGQEQGNHPGQPGQEDSHDPGQANENAAHKGGGERKDANANADVNGPRGSSAGNQTTYQGLPARDRQALKQTEKEKYPSEYGPAIEQYLKNLSDQENR